MITEHLSAERDFFANIKDGQKKPEGKSIRF
jgi:hypothetical protein